MSVELSERDKALMAKEITFLANLVMKQELPYREVLDLYKKTSRAPDYIRDLVYKTQIAVYEVVMEQLENPEVIADER